MGAPGIRSIITIVLTLVKEFIFVTDYNFSVLRSSHCCAVYYLTGVHWLKASDSCIEAALSKAKQGAVPEGHLPLVIEFSSAGGDANHDESPGAACFRFYKYLLTKGYRCDKFRLGKNSKSGNHVTLYHWFVKDKNKDVSIIRDFTYGERKKTAEANDDQSGASSGTGASGRSRSGRGEFGRVVSGARTKL